jgi:hypothetical protein
MHAAAGLAAGHEPADISAALVRRHGRRDDPAGQRRKVASAQAVLRLGDDLGVVVQVGGEREDGAGHVLERPGRGDQGRGVRPGRLVKARDAGHHGAGPVGHRASGSRAWRTCLFTWVSRVSLIADMSGSSPAIAMACWPVTASRSCYPPAG